jgi:hypothetical protein
MLSFWISVLTIMPRLGPKPSSAQHGPGPDAKPPTLQSTSVFFFVAGGPAHARLRPSTKARQRAVLPLPIRYTGLVWGADSSGLGSIPFW